MIASESNRSPVRVLIVDDDPDGALLLSKILEKRGYRAELVTDSTQAIKRATIFCPDVLVVDIAMPKISGHALAQQIRMQPSFENLPIIALSGYGDAEHMAKSFAAGCDQHLVKPVRIDALVATLAHEIERKQSGASSKGYAP